MKTRILLLTFLGCFAGQISARDTDAVVDRRRNTGNKVTAIEPTVESLPPVGEGPDGVELKRVYVQSKTLNSKGKRSVTYRWVAVPKGR